MHNIRAIVLSLVAQSAEASESLAIERANSRTASEAEHYEYGPIIRFYASNIAPILE